MQENHNLKIVILAAGKGKRLESLGFDLPKPLIPIHGRPMIMYLIDAVRESAVDGEPIIVTATDNRALFCDHIGEKACHYVVQSAQLGTGHAVMCAQGIFDDATDVMVLYGDHPTVSAQTIRRLADEHQTSNATLTMMTVKFPDYNGWRQWFAGFGRIVRDETGRVVRIVEARDATAGELALTEVNPAYMVFKRAWLCENVALLSNKNAQGEYYLTDLVELAVAQGQPMHTVMIDNPIEAIGINTPEQLKAAEEALGGGI
ncbi:MAG: sugar phosphate nucleotidyltransferase [Patescibacteria group bacterium]